MFKQTLCLATTVAMATLTYANENLSPDIEIIVDAKGNASLNQPTISPISVTADEIRASGISSIHDVFTDLFLLPISGDSGGNGVLGFPDLGGFGEAAKSNTLVLLNGRPLNNPTLEAPNLSFIPVNSITRIDLYQGGASTLFGSGATGGVINIITKQGALTFKNEVYAQSGSFGFGKTGANTETQLSNSLTLSANADFVTKDGYRHHTDYTSSSGAIAISNQALNHQWDFNYANSFQQRKDSGAALISNFSGDRKLSGRETTLDHRSETYTLNVLTPRAAGQHNAHLSHRESFQTGTDTPSQGQTTAISNLDYNYSDYEREFVYGASIQLGSYKGWHSGTRYQDRFDVFSRKQFVINEGSNSVMGARLAFVDDRISATNQKQQTVIAGEAFHEVATQLGSFSAGVDRSFRYANLDENASQILAPQTANSVRLRLNREDLATEVFYSQLKNEIIYDSVLSANTNIEDTSRYGAKLTYNFDVTSHTKLTATSSWVQTKIESGTFDGQEIPGVPSLTGGLKIESNLTDHQTLKLSVLYVSNSYPWSDFDNSLVKTNAYTTTTASWSYAQERFHGVLKINNLFNQTYNAYEIDAWNGHSITPAEPLNFEIGVTYEF
jgi:iron complex outermembrane receptor protein